MRIGVKDALFLFLLGWLFTGPVRGQSGATDIASVESASHGTHSGSTPGPLPRSHLSRSSVGSVSHSSVRNADPQTPRLLDKDEGLRVIAAAMGSHIRNASGDDCSRLVHDIYERAGFPYSYVSSRELYDGASQFYRVWNPQPGDLIVWAGHVGIVVSPKDRLFFSKLTSSGQDVSSYDTPYWRRRGRIRFLRYAVTEVAADGGPETKKVESASEDASSDPPGRNAVTLASASDAALASLQPHLERAATVTTIESRKPEPKDVRRAVMQQVIERGAKSDDPRAAASPTPLIIFDTLGVDHVRLDGNEGEAEVRIHQVGSVIGGRANSNEATKLVSWSLRRRDPETWEIEGPPDAEYLTREAAVPLIAHRLAELTEGRDSTGFDDKSLMESLAHLLNTLIAP